MNAVKQHVGVSFLGGRVGGGGVGRGVRGLVGIVAFVVGFGGDVAEKRKV